MDKSKTGLLDASELKPTTVSEIAEIQKLRTDAETKEPNKRGHFGSTFEYIFATVGNAIGLGNVWRFPYEVYEGGGAAFFIPFVLMLFLIGVPLLTLEGAVGQYSGQSGCIALRRMVPLARGLGWQFTLLAYLLSFYYAFLTALVLRYFFSAIASDGWEKCGESELGYFFNTESYFRLESDCEEMFGGMKNVVLRWYLRITTCLITPLILTWVIVMSLLQFRGPKYESYTFEWPLSVLWCLIILGITSPTIAGAIYQIVKTVYIDKRSWKDLFRTSPEWGPAPDALEKELTMGFGHDYEIAQKKIDGALLHAIRLRRDDIKRSSADAETEPSKETKVAKGPSASEAKAPLEA
ncbi:unnamed protein product [Cyprideis torosa]|uniref:Uncharacterized protein n=1 Tax=Cyprideis torosa TaxID=163714 RepID=A0A7R8ZL69_9CRUS|nr:unnamed protein product [Cyprideis torosa]CAG0891127.1 unnamed protein product [Cyprideis torosa]